MVLEDFLNTNTNEYKEILNIFEKARNRDSTVYKINHHHIVPRHCFKKFGLEVDNSPENMIYLTLGEHCMVHYYYSLIGKESWFINANRSSWQMLMKFHIGEVYKECKANIELMKLWCDTMDHKEYTCQSYERTEETRKKNGDAIRGEKNGMFGKTGDKHPNYGKHHTEEAREKMSEAHRGRIFYFVEKCKENGWTGLKILEEVKNEGIPLRNIRDYLKKDDEFRYLYELDLDKIKEIGGKRISERMKNWFTENEHPFKGKKQSDKARKKMSENGKGKLKGRKLSEETKKKMSEAQKGKRQTEESKEKNRQAHLGKIIPSKRKKILQYSLDGEFIREWECISDAAKELGLYTQNISKCCLGKRKSCKGFIWKYL